MHQRHVIINGMELATKVSDDDGVMSVSSSIKDKKFVPRRRRRQITWWPFSNRKGIKSSKQNTSFPTIDLDAFASFLQILSVSIMVGCIVTLLSRAINSYNLEDQPQKSFWQSLDFLGIFTTDYNSWRPRQRAHHYGVGLNAHYPKVPLQPSFIYEIPGSMSHIGDKSDRYALLRKEFDAKIDELPEVEPKHLFTPITTTDNGQAIPYDIYNCPDEPPAGYPFAWNLLQIVKAWPPDDATPRPQVYQGLCVFDYQKDLEKAYTYRNAELPFVIRNDPQVQKAVKRWNSPQYLKRLLGRVRHRAEYSESNHFMYWNPPPRQMGMRNSGQRKNARGAQEASREWKQPTEMIRMTYEDWLEKANITDDSKLGPDMPHWYFRLIGCGETGPEGQCDNGSSEYLFDELTFFQPKQSLYMVEPEEQKGIHCRFGMKGVIAENHFDGSRNMIAVLGGERRYILSHPDQCPYLSLLPKGHPSARHSAVDWSNPDMDTYPEFALAKGNEVVMQAGDVMYLPTNWFHYIISLSLNFQCNTRSGIGQEYMLPIHQCGF